MSTFETTRTNDEAFEKIYGELPHDVDSILNYQEARQHFYVGWQAATAEADKRIAELKANTSQIVQAVSRAADAREAGMENEIIALQAHINVLREALEKIAGYDLPDEAAIVEAAKQALTSTPAQSLQAHDDEVIERVVTLLKDSAWDDGIIDMRVDDLIEDVRGLKGNQFPYSANLDVYNSVIFSDAPYGTMIMESKIIKWLCRNRAKDYFDEMVEGK